MWWIWRLIQFRSKKEWLVYYTLEHCYCIGAIFRPKFSSIAMFHYLFFFNKFRVKNFCVIVKTNKRWFWCDHNIYVFFFFLVLINLLFSLAYPDFFILGRTGSTKFHWSSIITPSKTFRWDGKSSDIFFLNFRSKYFLLFSCLPVYLLVSQIGLVIVTLSIFCTFNEFSDSQSSIIVLVRKNGLL